MREVNINLSDLDPQYDCGHCGEANAASLIIDVSTIKNNASFLVVVFKNGYAETYCSERYYTSAIKNNKISVPLWNKLTKTEKEVAIVEAYAEDTNGNLTILNKSDKIHLYFEGSISSNDAVLDNAINGLYKELIELEGQFNHNLDILAAQITLVKTATDNANSKANTAENAASLAITAADQANNAAAAANAAKINADYAIEDINAAKTEAEQATQNANNATELATNAVALIEDAQNNANIALDAANTAQTHAENASQAANTANAASAKVQQIVNGVEEKINNALSGIDITTEIVSTIDGYIGYEDSDDILGLQVDFENKQFTRLAAAAGKTAGADFDSFNMYGGMKRCNVNNNGEITAYYGDEDFVDTDTNIQVMVYVPKFYYKVIPLKLDRNINGLGYHIRKANYYITDTPKAGFKLHPAFYDENGNKVDYFLYSAYEGALYRAGAATVYNDAVHTSTTLNDNDFILSRYNTKPISGQHLAITRTLAEKYCSNRGAGWHSETIQAVSALKLLMMIEYGSMNLQAALGSGVSNLGKGESDGVNYAAITGSTRNLGNQSGNAANTYFQYYDSEQEKTVTEHLSENTKVSCSYRGIENPYGNLWRYIQGINVWGDGTMAGGQPYICNDFDYNELTHGDNYEPAGFTLANANGFISAMGYGSEEYAWLIMPSEVNGTSALPVGDYLYTSPNANGHRIVRHGGAWNYGVNAGMFAMTSNSLYTAYGVTNGCRLIYIP